MYINYGFVNILHNYLTICACISHDTLAHSCSLLFAKQTHRMTMLLADGMVSNIAGANRISTTS